MFVDVLLQTWFVLTYKKYTEIGLGRPLLVECCGDGYGGRD